MRLASFFRTTILLATLTAIFLGVGFLIGGFLGATLALIIAFGINFFSYWYSHKIILSLYKAKPFKNRELEEMVDELSKKAEIRKPRLYLIDTDIPNAFATGRNDKNACIAVTSGLIQNLNKEEIKGVLAHELSHIKNKDVLVSTIAATIGGAISYLANIAWYSLFFSQEDRNSLILLPLLFLAPIGALLVQMGISRGREYMADYSAGVITRDPLSLANALRKIEGAVSKNPIKGNHATSHLFIVNPFKVDSLSKLFSTHPSTKDRIRRLEELNVKLNK
jgi:heat shock protein HtpX